MTHTNIDGRLLLVSGQNPDLDVGFHECCYGFWDSRLQSVFYRSGSQQQQVLSVAKRWKTERGSFTNQNGNLTTKLNWTVLI